MSFFNSMNVSSTGLTAQRLRMDIISQNIANVNTTKTKNGGPYRRKVILFEEQNNNNFKSILNDKLDNNSNGGVKVSKIIEDTKPLKRVYDPSHPEANDDGYVLMPNVNTVEEMVNMISANRSYEANVTALNASKSMAMKSLEIGK
ncbi:MAG: flagellar basal body rod protein FlgC [Vallitalea sp.]|nr:flagellar basal body rod protein FlgC [Vallitalea sp.]